jgi:4-hydroxy-3-polyprenylbenzoate decarboxylase
VSTVVNETGGRTLFQRHRDLRDVVERADAMGELLRIDGADWNLELGVLAEIVCHARPGKAPAVLFDNIPGYPAGFRVLSGSSNSTRRLSYLLGLPDYDNPTDVVRAYRDRMQAGFVPIPPVGVSDGPVLENVDRDGDVDLFKFPVPKIHEEDGGRYIGTNDAVIMRDPESGWVNVGTYRVVAYDRNTAGIWMSPGKHGRLIREKYFARGEDCPVVICCGHDPLLFLAASHEIDFGTSELAYAGGHRGRPFETIPGEVTGLPIPSHAELVLEGHIMANETRPEGPFGEFTGYYASAVREEPAIRVSRVYWRNDPILTMASPMRPPTDVSFGKCIVQSAMIWDEVEKAGLPGVQGVWCHEAGAIRMFTAVSIKQMYPGHVSQAGMLVANCHSGAYLARWIVVVDEDIDPTSLEDVVWAMSTRCDPAQEVEFIRRGWSTPLDPMLQKPPFQNSRAVIDACRPWGWKDEFPAVASASRDLREAVAAKFSDALKDL